jgi:hypothetical protein
MTHRVDAPEQAIDFNNENANTTANPTFESVACCAAAWARWARPCWLALA